MERKDLLLAEGQPTVPKMLQSEAKLSETVDEAASYINMMESRGWKQLIKNFIDPRASLSRILTQPGGRARDEATAAVAELTELMRYISGKIAEGQKANEQLEALRKQRRT